MALLIVMAMMSQPVYALAVIMSCCWYFESFEGRNIYSDSDDDDGDDGVSSYFPLVQLTDLCACTSPVHMVCMPGHCRSFYVLVALAVIAVAWSLHRKWNSARRFCEQRWRVRWRTLFRKKSMGTTGTKAGTHKCFRASRRLMSLQQRAKMVFCPSKSYSAPLHRHPKAFKGKETDRVPSVLRLKPLRIKTQRLVSCKDGTLERVLSEAREHVRHVRCVPCTADPQSGVWM